MKNSRLTSVIVGMLILQTIASIVIALFLFNYIADPKSEFNVHLSQTIQEYMSKISPPKGDKGDKGDDGRDGRDGMSIVGPEGPRGPVGADGQSIQGASGIDGTSTVGPQGETGFQGQAGPIAEFRCNPDTARNEYRYPGNEDWTDMGSSCIPIGE